MPDVTTQAVIEGGVLNGDGVQVSEQVHDMRDRCLAHRHLGMRDPVLRFCGVVGACPTTLWIVDVGAHPGGEALEVRGDIGMEGEFPGPVLEMQSMRNVVAQCVATDHVQKHVHQDWCVAGHLRKTQWAMSRSRELKSVG